MSKRTTWHSSRADAKRFAAIDARFRKTQEKRRSAMMAAAAAKRDQTPIAKNAAR
ncbi:hypothetical protein [Mesorhizobium sp.]|uniref:hypothetical protein n=1 Tax=Mesorhizobium sp. TaxID=1871066 RepID=UPI0025BA7C03|nr:hypothetical protein [Mesorhizobium sp.]